MKRLMTTWALVLAAGIATSACAQFAPFDKAKEAAARSTAASKGTPEQQQAINQQDSKPAPPPSQAVAPGKTMTAPAPAAKATASKAAPAAKNAKPTSAKAADAKEEAKVEAASPEMAKNADKRRDPFVSPIMKAASSTVTCSTGKRCLSVSEITLRGVVKSGTGMIAVVENAQKRTYFLHEKDEIFDAVVEKITGDTVVIRENALDNLGHSSTHEVVKKLNPTA